MNNFSFNEKKIKKEVSDFFEIDVSNIEIEFIPTRKDYDRIRGMKTKPWQIGTSKNGKVQVLEPNVWVKEGVHNPKIFPYLIKHEMVHVIYRRLTKGSSKPFWLNEGLAYYVSGQSYSINPDDKGLLPSDVHDKNSFLSQRVGYPLVENLVKEYGKESLLKLIKSIKPDLTRKNFEIIFREIYNKKPDSYYLHLRKGPRNL